MAVHQHAVPSGCQKEHRIFYAHIYIRSRRTNQLTFWKCYIFTWSLKYSLRQNGIMNNLHKSFFCSCFMNEAHRVRVIVHSSAKCGFYSASIATKEFVILTPLNPLIWLCLFLLSVNQVLVGGVIVKSICQ